MSSKALPVIQKGAAASTDRGYTAAVSCFNKFQEEHENPKLHDLTGEDVEGPQQMEYILGTFAFWLAHNSPKKSSGDHYSSGTIDLYFGKN